MIVINLNVVHGAHPADDVVGHRDHPHLQAAAKLQVRRRVAQEHDVRGIAADVNDKGARNLLQAPRLRHNSGVGLGIDEHMPDQQADRSTVVNEVYPPPLKIVRKSLPQRVVLRRQADRQIRLDHRACISALLQFLGDGEQRQDPVPLVLGLIPHIGDPLAGQRPELTIVFQHLRIYRRPDGIVDQAGRKHKVDRLHGRIAMVNGKQHEEPLLIYLGTSLHRAKCVFATECVKTAGHSANAPLSSATLALCPDSCRTPRYSRPDHCGPGPIDKYRM